MVLRTTDGGKEWQACAVPSGGEHLDFRAIQAFDESTAFVVSAGKGELSRMYETTDGCRTWKLLFTDREADGFWDALAMPTPERGWIVGDPVHGAFAVLSVETTQHCSGENARRSCVPVKRLVPAVARGLQADGTKQGAFAASNSSLFVLIGGGLEEQWLGTGGTAGAYVYRRKGNGEWEKATTPVGSGTESSGIFSLRFIRHGRSVFGVAVGGDYRKNDRTENTAAFSVDGGVTWQLAKALPHGYRSSVAYDATRKRWITVGPNGTDVSEDGRN